MRHICLALVVSVAVLAEDAVPPDVQKQVDAYLSARDKAEAAKLEGSLKDVPYATLERAVRASSWGDPSPAATGELDVFNPNGGARSKACYALPKAYSLDKEWPLLVSMHGTTERCGGQRDRWAPQQGDFIVLCPEEQEKRWGKGWGSTEDERLLELAAIEEARRRFRVDPDRVFLAGVSRGGHATWEMGLLYGDRFAGLYSNAGGPKIQVFPFLHNLCGVPFLETLGDKDQPDLVKMVREGIDVFRKDKCDVVYHEHAGAGHGVGYEDDAEFAKWVVEKKRDLCPKHLVRYFSRIGQGRAWWVQATLLASGVRDPTTEENPSIDTPPGEKLSDADIRRIYARQAGDACARIEATADGQKIAITTVKVREVIVYLSDRLLDLDQPLSISINGKPRFKDKVARDGIKMLRHIRESGDRGRIFANWMKLSTN